MCEHDLVRKQIITQAVQQYQTLWLIGDVFYPSLCENCSHKACFNSKSFHYYIITVLPVGQCGCIEGFPLVYV